MALEDLDIQFARIQPGGIGAFDRTFHPGPGEFDYIYNFDDAHWELRILREESTALCVQEYDVCPSYELEPFEYWIWNRHFLEQVARGLRGAGTLTIVYHHGWPWYFGCAWTTHPLKPRYGFITGEPPSWWGVEDTFCKWDSFEELAEAVIAEQHRNLNEYHHELLQRLP